MNKDLATVKIVFLWTLKLYTNMKIEHLAIWTSDLEEMKDFYVIYFNMSAGDKYKNAEKKFTSYFLTMDDGCRIELMHKPDLQSNKDKHDTKTGLAHFSISVGSIQHVIQLTHRLRTDGYTIASEPRSTGDGYYESAVLDPEGNKVEITV